VTLIIPSRTLTNDDVFRPEFVDDRLKLICDGFQRFIPADLLPLPIDLFHRMDNPIRMIGELRDGQTLGAHCPPTDGGIGIALDFDDLAVFYVGDHTAGTVTTSANGFNFFDFFHKQPPC
jgi:hypothetical protein